MKTQIIDWLSEWMGLIIIGTLSFLCINIWNLSTSVSVLVVQVAALERASSHPVSQDQINSLHGRIEDNSRSIRAQFGALGEHAERISGLEVTR